MCLCWYFWLLLGNTVNITTAKNHLSFAYSHYLMLRKYFFKPLDGLRAIFLRPHTRKIQVMVSLPSTIYMLSAKNDTKSKRLTITRLAIKPAIMDSNGGLETRVVTNINNVCSQYSAFQDSPSSRLIDN